MRPRRPATGAGQDRQQGTSTLTDFVRRGREDGAREQPGRARRTVGAADSDIRRRAGTRRLRPDYLLADHQPQQHDTADRFPLRDRRDADERQPPDQRRCAAAHSVGRWPLQRRVGRRESHNERCVEPVQSPAGLGAHWSVRAALLRNFTIDANRQALLQSQNRQQVADLELRQTLTQTTRAVRSAYFDLVNAIAGTAGRATVPRSGAGVAEEQHSPGRGWHDGADRDRPGAGGSRGERGIGDRIRGSDSYRRRIAFERS